MTGTASEAVLLAVLAFCRIGGCFLVLPGLSSSRVPMQVRILMAVAITVSLLSHIWPHLGIVKPYEPVVLLRFMASETFIGLFIGMSVRLFLLSLGFIATAIGMTIGFGNLMGPGFEETEPQAALGTLLNMAALLVLFLLDFHHAVVRSLVASYSVMSVDGTFHAESMLMNLSETLAECFMLVLRLGSPFLAYALVVNLMVGVLNKLTPQIPIYFVSLPFVIFGGLILLYFSAPTLLSLFGQGFFDLRVIR